MSDKLSIEVQAFTPHYKNSLRGFASIVIPELHLRINDLSIHESGRSRWVGMPARASLDADGVAMRDARGKVCYFPVLAFTDAETRDRFGKRVIEELLIFAPAAFEREDA